MSQEQAAGREQAAGPGQAASRDALGHAWCQARCRFRPCLLPGTRRNVPLGQLKHVIPGDQIRQGAYKMQLRPWEEAELDLVRAVPHSPAHVAASSPQLHACIACNCLR